MNHISKYIVPSLVMISVILLSACGPSASPADTISTIYTIAAQTIEAQYATEAQAATNPTSITDSTVTPFDMASPTNTAELAYTLPTSAPAISALSGSVCDAASYVSDVTIPDNTVVAAGQSFVKTWMFQNTGTCTWDANYTLTFISGDQMGGSDTPIGSSVVPGQQAELSVTLTAPTTAGQYTGYWRLADDSGELFGVAVYVLIDVTQDATATPTFTPETPTAIATIPIATATDSLSNTPTEAPQPSATASPTIEVQPPTNTETSVPAPTNTPVSADTVTSTNSPQATLTSTPGN